jgi:acetyl esterase/lipase
VPCIVVSIDYWLGPEYKFPTMLGDFEEGFNWVCLAFSLKITEIKENTELRMTKV